MFLHPRKKEMLTNGWRSSSRVRSPPRAECYLEGSITAGHCIFDSAALYHLIDSIDDRCANFAAKANEARFRVSLISVSFTRSRWSSGDYPRTPLSSSPPHLQIVAGRRWYTLIQRIIVHLELGRRRRRRGRGRQCRSLQSVVVAPRWVGHHLSSRRTKWSMIGARVISTGRHPRRKSSKLPLVQPTL